MHSAQSGLLSLEIGMLGNFRKVRHHRYQITLVQYFESALGELSNQQELQRAKRGQQG
jgi:hypothetical protein